MTETEDNAVGAAVPFRELLQKLTGQVAPFKSDAAIRGQELIESTGLGCSQLNEILVLHGYDRITDSFFRYLVDEGYLADTDTKEEHGPKTNAAFTSVEQFRVGIDRFRTYAILRYGNIKHAFKHLSIRDRGELCNELGALEPIEESHYTARHEPVNPIDELIHRVVTRTLELDLIEEVFDDRDYLVLREKTTGSIFRVVTGDAMLTNAFWNFYL